MFPAAAPLPTLPMTAHALSIVTAPLATVQATTFAPVLAPRPRDRMGLSLLAATVPMTTLTALRTLAPAMFASPPAPRPALLLTWMDASVTTTPSASQATAIPPLPNAIVLALSLKLLAPTLKGAIVLLLETASLACAPVIYVKTLVQVPLHHMMMAAAAAPMMTALRDTVTLPLFAQANAPSLRDQVRIVLVALALMELIVYRESAVLLVLLIAQLPPPTPTTVTVNPHQIAPLDIVRVLTSV